MRARPLLALFLLLGTRVAAADYSQHPRVPLLLEKLKSEYAFSDSELDNVRAALADAKQVPALIQAEQQAKEKTLNWSAYRPIHLFDRNIADGARFLREQQVWLAKAEREFGVPPPVIAAVLGVETKYGTQTGGRRALDALATQGFDHPTRAEFFLDELAAFFALCREQGFDARALKGSYAGALGAAQFMPSRYRRLALDFDGDGKKDLWSLPDAIGSVANYLANYAPATGWRRGEPIALPVRENHAGEKLARNAKVASADIAALAQDGVHPVEPLPEDEPAELLELTLDQGPEYWLGLPNFYSVMSYNPRVYYAMAVTQLSQALQAQMTEAR